jgi:hypothetical protein
MRLDLRVDKHLITSTIFVIIDTLIIVTSLILKGVATEVAGEEANIAFGGMPERQ